MEKETVQKKLKWITWPLIIVAFSLAISGYLVAGFNISDSVYSSLGLYQFQFTNVPERNTMLEIARWLAPISLATTLFIQIGPLFRFVRNRFVFRKYGCIIYSDTEMGKALCQSREKSADEKKKTKLQAVLVDKKTYFRGEKRAKTIIVMMGDDGKAFQIYERIRKYKNTRVILSLNSLEPNLIPSTGRTTIFNSNDLIAGAFWDNQLKLKDKKRGDDDNSFWESPDSEIHIVIKDYGMLGRRLLYKGLLLNLFSLQQKIIYHVITDNDIGKTHLTELRRCCHRLTYNGDEISVDEENTVDLDEIHFYRKADDCEKIGQADAVILTEASTPGELQTWLYTTGKPVIYYFDPNGSEIEKNLQVEKQGKIDQEASKPYERLVGFGIFSKVIRIDKMMNNRLNEEAKKFYTEYYAKEQRQDKDGDPWEKLPGFKRGLFLNQVDYSEIGVLSWHDDEENAQLGHAHWCRYHFLNHWCYGEKNWEDRTHPFLKPYMSLPDDKKHKNSKVIQYLLNKTHEE